MDKRPFTESDTCTKFITPALHNAGWDEMLQIREEVSSTKGRTIVRGKLVIRGQVKGIKAAKLKLLPIPIPPLADNTASSPRSMR